MRNGPAMKNVSAFFANGRIFVERHAFAASVRAVLCDRAERERRAAWHDGDKLCNLNAASFKPRPTAVRVPGRSGIH
jgi:hypothetical protein